ncbi:C40 family peptidase [Glaciibacter psychrotolerans]|uniref:Cell wall-associated NlpC family hydrolase n=1 Tax=Glaciibacter psychrotolerans TaxID=670054 RepID=A0A7Z0EC24_9MICO|nr:C40 family peptidase [Leifsonia psychrotolerans]NYJ18763.1 cell wall-associated NlpC family hydrolase [Leifsonia psychrotolerans]
MAITDALSRIGEIENRMLQLSSRVGTGSVVGTGASASTAASFSQTMGATAAPGAAPAGVTGSAIVEAAKKYLGVPYVFGGEDASGMDCSGLVQRVLADLGIDAPRVVSTQQHLGEEVGSLADAQPGDLIVTHNADHIVIYAGDGMIIHAPYEGRTVSLQKNYLTDADIKTIRRVTAAGASPAAAGLNRMLPSNADVSAATLNSLITSMGGTASASPNITDLIAAARMSMFAGRSPGSAL